MTSLAAGLGLGAAGYLVAEPGLAAGGSLVAAVGLYVERLQARSLRRRRRAERMRSRHEVTELRRTIAQLRLDVDAFQRALLDTEAALSARDLPLLPQPAPVAPPRSADRRATPVVEPVPEPVAEPVVEPVAEPVVVPVAQPVGQPLVAWVQTPRRDTADVVPLPAQQPSPFVAAQSGPLPVLPELPPRRSYDTGGIPVLEPAPRDRLSTTADALVYAALAELDERAEARRLAYPDGGTAEGATPGATRSA